MRATFRLLRFLVAILVVLQSVIPPQAMGGETLERLKRLFAESKYKGTEPRTGRDCAMEALAENIDWLEHHIDTYGSIVAKQPDIWGEARLTKHRDEYERMMFQQLGRYTQTINAAISQQDNAFLAQAVALSAAASGVGPITTGTQSGSDEPGPAVAIGDVRALLQNPDDKGITPEDYKLFAFEPGDDGEYSGKLRLEPVLALDQRSRYLKHLHELRRVNEGDDTSDSPGYSLNLVRIPVSILPGQLTRQGFGAEITITAEPVISDDLMPTTFQNLVINDVVDFLGLPLVRTTERLEYFDFRDSASEFEQTALKVNRVAEDVKAGAISPADALKSLEQIIQDFLDNELAVDALLVALNEARNDAIKQLSKSSPIGGTPLPRSANVANEKLKQKTIQSYQSVKGNSASPSGGGAAQLNLIPSGGPTTNQPNPVVVPNIQAFQNLIKSLEKLIAGLEVGDAKALAAELSVFQRVPEWANIRNAAKLTLKALGEAAGEFQSAAPAGRARRALNPINPSSVESVIGLDNIVRAARAFDRAYFGTYVRWAGGNNASTCTEKRANLLDARRFLDAEIKAAFQLLSEPEHVALFAELASPDSGLATQIRGGHFHQRHGNSPSVSELRSFFFHQLHDDGMHEQSVHQTQFAEQELPSPTNDYYEVTSPFSNVHEVPQVVVEEPVGLAASSVEALAWAIVVESALLNQRLNLDVRKLAKAVDKPSLMTSQDEWFFLPETVETPNKGLEIYQGRYQSANAVFKEYVDARWPIHAFAIDPVVQDQNIADVSQRKRELQFALALGFSTGQIGANSLTQFSRDLYTQVETVGLNRTVVGFGHSSDTFGWRFYPRVQALEVPGTLGTIRETLCGTSRDYDLNHRRLESGQRECVAVVLMPSFVPYADFDIRTDWFKLTNPKNTALTMKDSLHLSRAITAMRNSRAQCSSCQHLYREGELRRLFKRVDQLDRELPLQTERALVPYENTLGGFEMFNTGVTDLSPELIGYYGAPGINLTQRTCGCSQGCTAVSIECKDTDSCQNLQQGLKDLQKTLAEAPIPPCEGEGTTLFLVGDNFSIHDTKVIAGGVCIPHVRLISRELMQVTIPHCVNTVQLCENGRTDKYVAVYVATPYGITNHLHVPITGEAQPTIACPPAQVRRLPAAEQEMLAGRTNVSAGQAVQLTTFQQDALGESIRVPLAEVLDIATLEKGIEEGLLPVRERLTEIEGEVSSLLVLLAANHINGSQPPQVDVQVNVPSNSKLGMIERLCDAKEFPILNRLKTQVGEKWRNCRDQISCP
ncbi:MAG: hypothetical protein AAGD07_12960 [Planctomycetota bacterium]